MITKEVVVENLRDGNIIMIGVWASSGGFKARVHRILRYDDGVDGLYEVLFSSVDSPSRGLDQIVYTKGYKMTLVF